MKINKLNESRLLGAKARSNAMVEAMFIGYGESTIKSMIKQLQKSIEDYQQLIIDDPDEKDYWEEQIRECEKEIAELKASTPLTETSQQQLDTRKKALMDRIRKRLGVTNLIGYRDQFLPDELQESKELACISMIHSILAYSAGATVDSVSNDRYMKEYVQELGMERVRELVAEEIEHFKRATLRRGVFMDDEGVYYNSIEYPEDTNESLITEASNEMYVATPVSGDNYKTFTSKDKVYDFLTNNTGYQVFTVDSKAFKGLVKTAKDANRPNPTKFAFNRLHSERKTKAFESLNKEILGEDTDPLASHNWTMYSISNRENETKATELVYELARDGFLPRDSRYTGSKYYVICAKRGDAGKAVWRAVQYSNTSEPVIVDITYEQATGREPLDNFDGFRRHLGKTLLPRRENMNEASDFMWDSMGEGKYRVVHKSSGLEADVVKDWQNKGRYELVKIDGKRFGDKKNSNMTKADVQNRIKQFVDTLTEDAVKRFYVTVYAEDSKTGPEEGGYVSYGWDAISSKSFRDEESAKKYQQEFIEGAEIINQYGDCIEIVDEWDDRYKVCVEPAHRRGKANSPAKSWAQAELGIESERPYFDRNGKRVAENPRVTRQRERDRIALNKEFEDRLNSAKTRDEFVDIITDSKYISVRDDHMDLISTVSKTLTEGVFPRGFKLGANDIQNVKVYNQYGYTIQEVRINNRDKTFERGTFSMGRPDIKLKNRQQYEDVIDELKNQGYTEVPSDYQSLRNKSRKGVPTQEGWSPDMGECPICGDTSFDTKKGKCTKCSYRESSDTKQCELNETSATDKATRIKRAFDFGVEGYKAGLRVGGAYNEEFLTWMSSLNLPLGSKEQLRLLDEYNRGWMKANMDNWDMEKGEEKYPVGNTDAPSDELLEKKQGFIKRHGDCRILYVGSTYVVTDSKGLNIGESPTMPGAEAIAEEHSKKTVTEDIDSGYEVYGSWDVEFDLTLEGEDVRFDDLSETTQEHIATSIKDGSFQGEIVEDDCTGWWVVRIVCYLDDVGEIFFGDLDEVSQEYVADSILDGYTSGELCVWREGSIEEAVEINYKNTYDFIDQEAVAKILSRQIKHLSKDEIIYILQSDGITSSRLGEFGKQFEYVGYGKYRRIK